MKSEWSTIKAADFLEFNPRLSIKKGATVTKVAMDKLQPFTKKIPETEQAVFSGGAKFCNGDTIMARITPCLENGKTAFVDILTENEVAFGSTEFIVMRAKEGISDPQFIYYLATSPEFRNVAIKSMVGSSGRQRVQQGVLNDLELQVPPLKEQKRIGLFLSAIDDRIALNSEINDNLQQQAQALFADAFPAIAVGEQKIGDYIIPKRGKSLLSKDAIPGDVPVVAGGLDPSTYHNAANTASPAITISASGANAGFVNLWEQPVWSSDSSFIDASMTKQVYFWYVLLKKRQQEIFDAQTGSAQPHIYPQHIADLPIAELDEEEVNRFSCCVAPMFQKIGMNKQENRRLAALRDALLPRLMSGEIDVSDVQI